MTRIVQLVSALFAFLVAAAAIASATESVDQHQHIDDVSSNETASLRQYTCGSSNTVYVAKGYQVPSIICSYVSNQNNDTKDHPYNRVASPLLTIRTRTAGIKIVCGS